MSDLPEVYVVFGSAGVYDSYGEWPVAYYLEEGLATSHAELAEARANEIEKLFNDCENKECRCWLPCDEHKALKNQWDGNYDGRENAGYSVLKIPLGSLK